MRLTDRYRLERQVGQGGGGGVYLVRDRFANDALMVLKRLHAQGQAGVTRWLVNEFQVLAQLDLPSVARVFDFGLAEPDGSDPGGPFFTREFVDGLPLDQALGEPASMVPSRLVDLLASVAETLGALHRLGVVHGDLKPANLIVPRDGSGVVLIDFGLAHGALGAVDRVRGGTLAFMPPERKEKLLAGEALPPDPGADLYALAVSLLVLLGVESPDAPTPDWAMEHPDVRALIDVGRRGAARDPERRYSTAEDFLAALGVSPRRTLPSRVVLRPEGREHELGILLDHVARRLLHRDGGVPVVLLCGEEGSGRTTLLRELTWRAQLRGVQVVHVQGEPGEGPARRLRLGAEVLSGRPLDDGDPETLLDAFRHAARTAPVLILADDLDRADPAIASQLRSIAYGCDTNEPLLVVASAVDSRAVSGLVPAETVVLGPLDDSTVAALCRQILGPVEPGVVAAVRARTGGWPLAVTEMLVALAGSGAVTVHDVEQVEIPTKARDLFRRRATSLPMEVRHAGAIVAALGGVCDSVHAISVGTTSDALDQARACGILNLQSNGKLALTHTALGDALLDTLGPEVRAGVLLRAAEVLERTGAPAETRARAWIRAGQARRALACVDVQGLRTRGLPLAAAQLLASIRALDASLEQPALLLEEAELYFDAGAMRDAAALAERVRCSDSSSLAQRARLLCGKAWTALGEHTRATEVLSEGLACATDGDTQAEFLRELAVVDVRVGAFAEAVRRCEQGLIEARGCRVRAALLATAGLAKSYLGDQHGAIAQLEQALALIAEQGELREKARVLSYLAIARDRSGDSVGARELFEQALECSRAAGDIAGMASARLNLGNVLEHLGDLAAAMEHFDAAAKLARRAGRHDTELTGRLNMAGVLIRLGCYDRARAELESVLTTAQTVGYRESVAHALGMLGVVRARRGETDLGLEQIADAQRQFAALGLADAVADAHLDAAEILLDRDATGDVARATQELTKAQEALANLGTLQARARLIEGRVLLAQGNVRGAQRVLDEAIAMADGSQQWEVLSQALAVRAETYRATGAEIHARRDRERALEVLESIASVLQPDLRSAFWNVMYRAKLRAHEPSWPEGASVTSVTASGSVSLLAHAPTVMAQDQRLVLLLELSRRVGEETSLERVLQQAVRSAVELTNAERGAVLLVDGDGNLSVRARAGLSTNDGPDEQFSRSIAETVLIDGEAVVTHNARSDQRFADFRSVHELSIGAVAAVPIRARGRTLGVLYVENRRRRNTWSPADVALMQAFAEQAGIAVEHARVVEELEARSRELEAAKREIETLLAIRTEELEATRRSLQRAEEALRSQFQGMVARTEAMRKVFTIIERVRDTDVPVVIEGESGTGKELVARAIHYSGARSKGPFVVVPCGAMTETLLESELFGHVRGAFTGADRDRKGLIASAHGGTLVLDEVAEMPARMQVELLRVLQDRRVRPIGSDRDEPVDVRVVAISRRPLRDLVAEGRFREDLYYRLSVVTVSLPPLRARVDDIPALANHFLACIAEEHGMPRKRLSREALVRLLHAPWPGNVRQLRHVLERAAVLTDGDVIEPDQLVLEDAVGTNPSRSSVSATAGEGISPLAARKAAERQRILDALEQVNWNKVRAAMVLGMPRRTLYRRLREYGLLED